MEGPEGPLPKDTDTPELQSSYIKVVKLICQYNNLRDETLADEGIVLSGLKALVRPVGNLYYQ